MNIQTIQFIIIIILLITWKGAVKRSADDSQRMQHKISELQNQNTLLNSKYQTESAALKDEKAAVSKLTSELDNRNTHFER